MDRMIEHLMLHLPQVLGGLATLVVVYYGIRIGRWIF
jgi:hypothetical protein